MAELNKNEAKLIQQHISSWMIPKMALQIIYKHCENGINQLQQKQICK